MNRINNRYQVVREIGKGGMGRVVLAKDEFNGGRLVAVKLLNDSKNAQRMTSLLMDEFKFLRTLNHQNIAKVYDFGTVTETGGTFFTIEYIEGPNLLSFAKKHSVESMIEITVQICRALTYIHARGIIHSDIKPSNILVATEENSFRAKVMDFSISSHTFSNDRRRIRGSPAFIAPELIANQDCDHRIDFYSLGVTLYYVVFGDLPFRAEDEPTLFRKILEDPIKFPQQNRYPQEFVTIVRRLCERKPWNRYSNANDIITDLNQKLNLRYTVETEETKQSYVTKSRLLERETPIGECKASIESIKSSPPGRSPHLLIKGGKGVGKSRLLDELKSMAQLSGVHTIDVDPRRLDAGVSLPKLLLLYLQEIDSNSTPIETELPELNDLEEGVPTDTDLSKATLAINQQKYGLYKQVSDRLIRVSSKRPILVLIDDIHQLDRSSSEFLNYLLAELRYPFDSALPAISLIGTILVETSSFNTPESQRMFERSIYLSNFKSADTVREFVFSALNLSKAPPDFIGHLFDITQGNPLLLTEFLSLLVERGLITFADRTEIMPNINLNLLDAPRSLESIYLHHVAHYAPETQAVLRFMSCFSNGVPVEVVMNQLTSDAQINDYYRLLAEKVLVHQRAKNVVQFANNGLRRALYESMSPADRHRHHARVLELLESIDRRLRPDPDQAILSEFLSEAADQSRRLLDPSRAVYYNLIAARRHMRTGAIHSAVQHLETCLQFSDHVDRGDKFKIVWNLINLHCILGNYETAQTYCHQISREVTGAAAVQKEIAIKLATIYKDIGNHSASLKTLEELEMVVSGGSLTPLDQARIFNLRATCQLARSLYDGVVKNSKAVLQLVDGAPPSSNSTREKIKALGNLAQVNTFMGEFERAKELLHQALGFAQDHLYQLERIQILSRIGYAFSAAGDLPESLFYYHKAYEISKECHSLRGQAVLSTNLANSYFKLGEIDKALSYFEDALKTALKMNALSEQAYCKASLGNLYRLIGLETMAEQTLNETYLVATERGWLTIERLCCKHLVLLYLDTDQLDQANWWMSCLQKGEAKLDRAQSEGIVLARKLLEFELRIRQGALDPGLQLMKELDQWLETTPSDLEDRYCLLKGRFLFFHDDDSTRSLSFFERALRRHELTKKDSMSLEHLDLAMNIHLELARLYSRMEETEKGAEHYKRVAQILGVMTSRVPERYQRSFLTIAHRSEIQIEATRVLHQFEEVTAIPFLDNQS